MNTTNSQAILITGGTKGLGLGIARRIAKPGIHLFLSYRSDESAAKKAHAELSHLGAEVHLLKGDISTPEEGRRIIDQTARYTGDLQGLVHCAAVANPGYLLEQTFSEIDEAVRIGGLALLYLVQPALKLLVPGSSVIFLSGAAIEIALPQHGALALAKAAGEMIVRYLAIECGPRNIRVNTLRSGPVDTGLYRASRLDGTPPAVTPRGRQLSAEDVADAAAFLLSPSSNMVSGQYLMVDGGLSATVRRASK